jgi:hypothetical protein
LSRSFFATRRSIYFEGANILLFIAMLPILAKDYNNVRKTAEDESLGFYSYMPELFCCLSAPRFYDSSSIAGFLL